VEGRKRGKGKGGGERKANGETNLTSVAVNSAALLCSPTIWSH